MGRTEMTSGLTAGRIAAAAGAVAIIAAGALTAACGNNGNNKPSTSTTTTTTSSAAATTTTGPSSTSPSLSPTQNIPSPPQTGVFTPPPGAPSAPFTTHRNGEYPYYPCSRRPAPRPPPTAVTTSVTAAAPRAGLMGKR